MFGRRRGLRSIIIWIFTLVLIIGFYTGFRLLPVLQIGTFFEGDWAKSMISVTLPARSLDPTPLTFAQVLQKLVSPKYVLASSSLMIEPIVTATADPDFSEDGEELLEAEPTQPEGEKIEEQEETPKDNAKNADESPIEGPIVCIYCTHNAESYANMGADRLEGKNGGVFEVAKQLQSSLEKTGIQTVLCETIHDYPEWTKSYANSLESLKKMKKKYPSLQIYIDVHRDAAFEGVSTTFENDGKKAAKVMLIVGSNQRLTHDNWKENLAFSQSIGSLLEKNYPGILRGVRVQDGRYNQHFSPKCILLEVGSTDNTLAEAKASAQMIAKTLSEILK